MTRQSQRRWQRSVHLKRQRSRHVWKPSPRQEPRCRLRCAWLLRQCAPRRWQCKRRAIPRRLHRLPHIGRLQGRICNVAARPSRLLVAMTSHGCAALRAQTIEAEPSVLHQPADHRNPLPSTRPPKGPALGLNSNVTLPSGLSKPTAPIRFPCRPQHRLRSFPRRWCYHPLQHT